MSKIITCDYCDSVIEYDNSDIKMTGTWPNEYVPYIDCPECGMPITVGYFKRHMGE